MSVDLDLVRACLTIPDLLHTYGFEATSAKADRYNDCPSCGAGCRGKFKTTDEVCLCHSCGFKGDIFAVAGAILGLSNSSFPEVISVCASLAGVEGEHDPGEVERTIERRRAQRARKAQEQAVTRDRAERGARQVWDKLSSRSSKGQEYVASRGIHPLNAGKECRYTSRSVCLPLWREGAVVNVVGRRFDGGKPKIRGLDSCGTVGTFGEPKRRSSHAGPVIIVEGFFDYLSAREMSSTRLVLGAHGCHNLPYVAKVAAGLVGSDFGLVLVTHRDDAGRNAMALARDAAISAGVSPLVITEFAVSEGCNDLNDQLCGNGKNIP